MKTLITTIVTLLLTVTLTAQNYVAVNTSNFETDVRTVSTKKISKTKSVSALTLEIYETSNFEYRTFLKDAEDAKKRYQIGREIYTKKELVKIFRKGARRSENVIEFEEFLTDYNPKFLNNVSERETADIFTKFREGTLHAYLDKLPSGIF
ncbi:hypothetical protein Q2T40_15960 [Winogradskyella maritima]|uniref:GLPGLI family protein n=1 Tax=Winogradskyella maritima TaxID=1517766 RepID=A0ABV8AJB3_9FLAO|nr:hypothetical protein [Winogradskyella maritima]